MYDMLIRKKVLKIQERLGMRLGIKDGTTKIPIARNPRQIMDVLEELYRVGLKAFVLPKELFSGISTSSDLYKEHYGELLKIKELASKYNIELSLHHSALTDMPDDQMKAFSDIVSIMDARIFTIHPSFYSRMPQAQALKLVVYKINEIVTGENFKAKIGIETTGKTSEVGSLEDVIDIVKRTQHTEPVLNWAHIHARHAGALRDQRDYRAILDKVRAELGTRWLENAFMFFSGVSYGPSGEIKHIPLDNSDISLEYLIRELMGLSVRGTLIIEDPDREKFILQHLEEISDMVR